MSTIKTNNIHDKNITLERESHTYILDDNPELSFISVTTFISQFFEKFDSMRIATKLVSKVPKYKHMTVDELLLKWKGSADHGTKVHNEIEEYLINKIYPDETKAIQGIDWLDKHVFLEKHELYSEKIIYSTELKIAGSVDLIIKNTEKDEYTLIDWKTNEKIPTNSYDKKTGIHPLTSDIDDCKFNLYSLQLSLYRFILENYYDMKINRQLIVHLKDNKVLAYMAHYYEDHIKKLTQHRVNTI